jgi:hypothetical protein
LTQTRRRAFVSTPHDGCVRLSGDPIVAEPGWFFPRTHRQSIIFATAPPVENLKKRAKNHFQTDPVALYSLTSTNPILDALVLRCEKTGKAERL